MEATGKLADPVARGTLPSAKQAFRDLFRWEQRVEFTNEHGERQTEWQRPLPLRNPISLLALLSLKQWIFYIVGFAAWMVDAFDFHALSIQTVKLSHYYNVSKTSITTAITLTLLLRSVGAALFGIAGDRYGRKWPMVANMLVLGLLQIATIYCNSFSSFLGVRSLFGIFMGGVYGNAVAMALENCPVEARGLMSGILQQGYSCGYVLAAVCNLGVGGSTNSWKIVFWVGAGFSIAVGIIRTAFPESQQFRERKAAGYEHITPQAFWDETRRMLKQEWRLCIYCVFLMSWMNCYSHASQDSYTTFMLTQKGMNNHKASVTSIIMKTGACVGGATIGYYSQWFGRRRSMVLSVLTSALLIPAWILPDKQAGLAISAFLLQFFVQGAWGIIPIHLNELSPPAFRSSFPGLTYQLGNLFASPAAQIVNAAAEHLFISDVGGPHVPAYGPVMGVATTVIATAIMLITAVGPEKRGRRFENAVVGQEGSAGNVAGIVEISVRLGQKRVGSQGSEETAVGVEGESATTLQEGPSGAAKAWR